LRTIRPAMASEISPPPRRVPSAALLLVSTGALTALLGAALGLVARTAGWDVAAADLFRLIGSVVLLSGLGIATVGLGIYVFAPPRRGPAAAAAGLGSHRVMLSTTAFAILTIAVVGNLLPLLAQLVTGQRGLRNLPGFLAAGVVTYAVLLGVPYLRFIRPGVVSTDSFGFGDNRAADRFGGRVWLADLVIGLGGGVAVLFTAGLVQLAMRGAGVQQTQMLDYTWVRQLPAAQFGLIWVAGTILAPLAEELFFRGILFRAYLETKGPLVAYALSSLIFSLLHLNLPAAPALFVLGLLLAAIYHRTGSLTPAIIAHGFNNGVAFLVLRYVDLPAVTTG
jgi:uncharacterized protein